MNSKTETPQGSGIYYTLTDKHFFAVQYNTALHNVFLTLNQIFRKLGEKEIEDDSKIVEWFIPNKGLDSFLKKKNAIEKDRLFRLLGYHFPFLEYAQLNRSGHTGETKANNNSKTENQPDNYPVILLEYLNLLKGFRNYFSHAVDLNEITLDHKLMHDLNAIWDKNVNTIKRDFFEINAKGNLHDDPYEEHVKHLRRKVKNPIRNASPRTIDNPAFKLNFFDWENKKLIEHGHVLFLSLFLEKNSSILLQKKIRGLKGSQEIRFRMTNEALCRTRIRMPRIKLESTKNQDALALDMINELAKAPEPFYAQLGENEKALFRSFNFDEIEDGIVSAGKRFENRFNYFALRFLDSIEGLKNTRFQINLGNYHFHLYEAVINGETESRHLTRRLFGFGRIQEFDKKHAPQEWKDKQKDLDFYEQATEPFIPFKYPHYHIEKNKIGLRFGSNKTSIWPHLNLELNSTKYAREPNENAQAFLSGNDLAALIFCHFLYSSSDEPTMVESIIRDKYKGLKNLFSDLAKNEVELPVEINESWLNEKYNLRPDEIPIRLWNELKGITAENNLHLKSKERLNELIKQNERLKERFKALKTSGASPGKKQFKRLESGKFAGWLAKEMVRFQPIYVDANGEKDLKSKANNKQFQLIQKSFALYAGEKTKIESLLKSCRLIDSPNSHPFLKAVVNKNHATWISFYEHYLAEREHFLKKCLNEGNWENYFYFLKIKLRNTPIQKMAEEAWLKQLLLPSNLFYSAIVDWFKTHKPNLFKNLSQSTDRPNLNHIVLAYLAEKNDAHQPFYSQLPLVYFHYMQTAPNGLNLNQRLHKIKDWTADFLEKKERLKVVEQKIIKACEEIKKEDRLDDRSLNILLQSRFGLGRVNFNALNKKLGNKPRRPADVIKFVTNEIPKELKIWIKSYRYFLDNEQKINQLKAEDAIMSLMIHNLLKSEIGANENDGFKLSEISPIGEDINNFLNGIQDLTQSVKFYEADDKGKINKAVQLGTWRISSTDTKRKNKGTFLHFVKDRRLNNLAQFVLTDYTKPIEINRKRLEFELDIYENNRAEYIKHCHELEMLIWKNLNKKNTKFRNLLEDLEKTQHLSEAASSAIPLIWSLRNAFLHNQYPNKKLFESEITFYEENAKLEEKEGLGIARQLLDLGSAKCQLLISEIKNLTTH